MHPAVRIFQSSDERRDGLSGRRAYTSQSICSRPPHLPVFVLQRLDESGHGFLRRRAHGRDSRNNKAAYFAILILKRFTERRYGLRAHSGQRGDGISSDPTILVL